MMGHGKGKVRIKKKKKIEKIKDALVSKAEFISFAV